MSVLEALVLGVIQGLTEFLPVSSTGHLVIGETLMGVELDTLTFEILVHLATLGAVVVALRSSLRRIVSERDLAYAGKIALACLPAGLVGILLRAEVERVFHDPAVTGVGLLFTGCVLLGTRVLVRTRPPAGGRRPAPTSADALFIGLAQAVAILPGVSRSGMTIAAGLVAGVAGPAAAEFSFLVALPVIAGASLLEADAFLRAAGGAEVGALAAGFAAAFVFGLLAIRLVYRLLERRRFTDFAFYCLPAGTLFLLYLWLR